MQNGFESVFGDKMTPSEAVHQICIKYLDSSQAFPESPTFKTKENINTIFAFINFIQDFQLELLTVVRIVQLAMDFQGAESVHFMKLLEFVVDYQIKMAPSFLMQHAQLIWDSITALLYHLRNENVLPIVIKLFKYIVVYCNDVFLSQEFTSFFNDNEPVDVAMLEAVSKLLILLLDFVEPTKQFLKTILMVMKNNFQKCFQYSDTDTVLSRLLKVLQRSIVTSVDPIKISESACWVFHENKTVFDLMLWFGMTCSQGNTHVNSLIQYLKVFSLIFAEKRFSIATIGPHRFVFQLLTLVNSTVDVRFILKIIDMLHAFAPDNRKDIINALWTRGFENHILYAVGVFMNSFMETFDVIQERSDILGSYILLFNMFKSFKFHVKQDLQHAYRHFVEFLQNKHFTNEQAAKCIAAFHAFFNNCFVV